jgi:DNA modification methylase
LGILIRMIPTNIIYCSDNLDVLKNMPDQSIDLIYLDPPFLADDIKTSQTNFETAQKQYINMLQGRIAELHRVLASNGSFFCHCDWRIEANIQLLLNRIFKRDNLISKIIWKRSFIPKSSYRFIPNSYDVILFYGKTKNIKFNRQYIISDQRNDTTGQYHYTEPETGRIYRLISLTIPNKAKIGLTYEFMGVTRAWRWTKEKMEEELRQGRIIQTGPGTVPMYKEYVEEGDQLDDIWSDQQLVSSKENIQTGYPLEKPVNLLRRIIQMSTNELDIVLDPFCGSGSTLVAAQELERKWIGIDISPTACRISVDRMVKKFNFIEGDDIKLLNFIEDYKIIVNLSTSDFENWVITALDQIKEKNTNFINIINIKTNVIEKPTNLYFLSKGRIEDFLISNKSMTGEAIPVEIKQKKNVNPLDVQKFAQIITRNKKNVGIFIAIGFSKSGMSEIQKWTSLEKIEIIPVSIKELLSYKLGEQ